MTYVNSDQGTATRSLLRTLTRTEMDRAVDEHLVYEEVDDVESVLATLDPEVTHIPAKAKS